MGLKEKLEKINPNANAASRPWTAPAATSTRGPWTSRAARPRGPGRGAGVGGGSFPESSQKRRVDVGLELPGVVSVRPALPLDEELLLLLLRLQGLVWVPVDLHRPVHCVLTGGANLA